MNKKLYWGLGVLFILIIGGFVFLLIQQKAELNQWEADAAKDKKLATAETPPIVENKPPPPEPGYTWVQHGDHFDKVPLAATSETPVQHTAPKGTTLKPVFPTTDTNDAPVKAAYKRLEYIKNNPYAWGGVHSQRATELIAELMTESGPIRLIDHNHGEQVIELITELIDQDDPRAAEVLIAHMCDGDTVGGSMFDALDEIGPPAVPYILPYLEKGVVQGGYIRLAVFESLGRIGARYRDDLGGIVDHIIIPKLKVIAADEDNERYDSGSVIDARGALARLQ